MGLLCILSLAEKEKVTRHLFFLVATTLLLFVCVCVCVRVLTLFILIPWEARMIAFANIIPLLHALAIYTFFVFLCALIPIRVIFATVSAFIVIFTCPPVTDFHFFV